MPECHHPLNETFRTCSAQRNEGNYDESLMRGKVCGKKGRWFDDGETSHFKETTMSVRVLRQLSAAFASVGAALREAADDLEKEVTGKASESAPAAAAEKPKAKPGPKVKEKIVAAEVIEDPLAGLTGGDSGSEPEPVEEVEAEDPLAALMGEPEEPAAPPPITKPELAKILQEFVTLVDKVKGKGKGADALVGLFKKHDASDLKSLKEEEFLGVKNEASAVIAKIKEMTA